MSFAPGYSVLDYTLETPGDDPSMRADLGIGNDDLAIKGRSLTVTVHSLGHVASPGGMLFVEDAAGKDALLKKLIGDHEPPYAEQWRSLGEEFAHKMLAGIVAFELDVERWECKLKLNQHRREAHARMREAYAAGNENDRELAAWMQRLGMGEQ